MLYQTKCRLIYDTEIINIFVSVNVFLSLLNVLVSMMRQKSFAVLEGQGKLLVPMARSVLLACRVVGGEMGDSPWAHTIAQQEKLCACLCNLH